jgi:hypothetical protein
MNNEEPSTSIKIKQLMIEWSTMIKSFVPEALQQHMLLSIHGMKQVIEEVEILEKSKDSE